MKERINEIKEAVNEANIGGQITVCVVPVRMQEAWLLFNEAAIKEAAANPNSSQKLGLPSIKNLEALPDPKSILYSLLREASGLSGRRLKNFRVRFAATQVSTFIHDFSNLRKLAAFNYLENNVKQVIAESHWDKW